MTSLVLAEAGTAAPDYFNRASSGSEMWVMVTHRPPRHRHDPRDRRAEIPSGCLTANPGRVDTGGSRIVFPDVPAFEPNQ
jgi:hypothetical protein